MNCTKRCFRTKGAAKRALKRWQSSRNRTGITACRAYRCRECGYFHLTSQSYADREARMKEITDAA